MSKTVPDIAAAEPAYRSGRVTGDGPDYPRLIRPDRVHGSLYTDPRIFADELARIWYRTWVYVGHLSEIPEPGDYVRKNIGLQDVIMTRDADGRVHLLLNRCAHRANLVCEAGRGNSKSFRCPYHGWTYRNTGELIPVRPGIRRPGHDRSRAVAGRGAAIRLPPGLRVRQHGRGRPVADRAPRRGGR